MLGSSLAAEVLVTLAKSLQCNSDSSLGVELGCRSAL